MEIRESTPKGAITGGKAESGGGGSEGKRIYCLIIMRGFDKNRLRRPLKTSSSFAFVPVARIHFFLGFETDFVVTFHSDRTSAAAINTEMEMSSARATLLCFSISNNRNALCVRERGSATKTDARLRGSPAGCFAIHAAYPLWRVQLDRHWGCKNRRTSNAFIEMRAALLVLSVRFVIESYCKSITPLCIFKKGESVVRQRFFSPIANGLFQSV